VRLSVSCDGSRAVPLNEIHTPITRRPSFQYPATDREQCHLHLCCFDQSCFTALSVSCDGSRAVPPPAIDMFIDDPASFSILRRIESSATANRHKRYCGLTRLSVSCDGSRAVPRRKPSDLAIKNIQNFQYPATDREQCHASPWTRTHCLRPRLSVSCDGSRAVPPTTLKLGEMVCETFLHGDGVSWASQHVDFQRFCLFSIYEAGLFRKSFFAEKQGRFSRRESTLYRF
jgi:hypothetical protein